MASLVAAMLGAAVGSVVKASTDLGGNFIQKKVRQWAEFDVNIGEINRNLEMKLANWEKQFLQEVINPSKEQKISLEQMVDLAYDIEDCLDRVQRCRVSWHKLSDKVEELKTRLEKAPQGKQNNNNDNPSPQANPQQQDQASSSTSPHQADKLVGINEPMKEIIELLEDMEGQQEQTTTKVICIVGFCGTGKSKLAEEVFNCTFAKRFPCRGKVIASKYKDKPDELLKALSEDINRRGTDHVNNITDLQNKRYFILLDDIIDKEQWFSIRASFPDKKGGVIIVTTKDQTVAIACRNHGSNSFLYNMRTLNETHCSEYFTDFFDIQNKAKFEKGLRLFASNCDGHPLSLASMTKYLMGQDEFTEKDFHDFWNNLGDRMKKDNVFRELEQKLVDSYMTLDCNDVRAFLLYLCLFPNGHPIWRKRLTRRWLAEGRSSTQLDSYLKKLVEKNVVRTLESSKDISVKCCRVHGIIHGFMMHISKPTKFIASAGSCNDVDRGKYRHLYFKGGELEEPDVGRSVNSQDKNSFRAHSLTICGSAGKKYIADLPKCKVLRVLDLEECDDLKSDDIKIIDKKLWHLKYLSLGPSIDKLPENVDRLHHLEMLDLRKTEIDTIPEAVIKLHRLAHLLGKFKLEKKDWLKHMVDKFFEKKSNLETLAGFVTDGNPRFPMLMTHMEKLNRVKIWCDDSVGNDNVGFNALPEAIRKFVEARLTTCKGDHSLSLYLGNSSNNILSSIWDDREIVTGYLTSLKLDGALRGLTKFARFLSGLKELCLSSTNGLTNNELTYLHMLKELKYLKLVNVNLESFEIGNDHFPKLLRLCLVQCNGRGPRIGAEALPCIESLWIINKNMVDLSEINIENHKHLQEVALDSSVEWETIRRWDEAAKKHPKRPKVLFFKCASSNGTKSMVKCVAVERDAVERAAEAKEKAAVEAKEKAGAEAKEKAAAEAKERERAAARERAVLCTIIMWGLLVLFYVLLSK